MSLHLMDTGVLHRLIKVQCHIEKRGWIATKRPPQRRIVALRNATLILYRR